MDCVKVNTEVSSRKMFTSSSLTFFWVGSVLKDYFWKINEYIKDTAHTIVISWNLLKLLNAFTNDNNRIKISKMLYAFMVGQNHWNQRTDNIKDCSFWRWNICWNKIIKISFNKCRYQLVFDSFKILKIIQKTSQYFNMYYLLVLFYILINFMWYTF